MQGRFPIALNEYSSAISRIPFLDSIRAIGAFMVVAIHTMGYVPLESSDQAVISFLVHAVAVPIFFLVDGVIFANKSNEIPRLNYSNHVLRSARRLLVPWVIFSVFYLLLRFLFESGGFF